MAKKRREARLKYVQQCVAEEKEREAKARAKQEKKRARDEQATGHVVDAVAASVAGNSVSGGKPRRQEDDVNAVSDARPAKARRTEGKF